MKTDTEVRLQGLNILKKYMEIVDVERFISLIQKDQFDYTKWRKSLHQELEHLSLEEISIMASKG